MAERPENVEQKRGRGTYGKEKNALCLENRHCLYFD